MSADNGYIVSKLHNSDRYGVFYYIGDFDQPADYFTEDHAIFCHTGEGRMIFDDPREAIVKAHFHNNHDYTEYGVHVNGAVLLACW
jgi:hypothetical protein